MHSRKELLGRLAVSGATTLALYVALFANEAEVMASYTRTDGLYPLLPVVTALVFSFAHGAFTGYFWEALGVRPRAQSRAQAAGRTED